MVASILHDVQKGLDKGEPRLRSSDCAPPTLPSLIRAVPHAYAIAVRYLASGAHAATAGGSIGWLRRLDAVGFRAPSCISAELPVWNAAAYSASSALGIAATCCHRATLPAFSQRSVKVLLGRAPDACDGRRRHRFGRSDHPWLSPGGLGGSIGCRAGRVWREAARCGGSL